MIQGHDLVLFERSLRNAVGNQTGAALDAALEELGWPEALRADPRVAVSLLFSLQGEANATSSALDQVLSGALGSSGRAVVLPPLGEWVAPGTPGSPIKVEGVGTASFLRYETALVVAGAGESFVAVEVGADEIPHRAIAGIDSSLQLVSMSGEVGGRRAAGPVDWRSAVALGQLAIGHELVGASRRMLELARQHALDRVQFGRPIAKFQAIRHRLADTLVAVEAADAALEGAWLDHTPQVAALAKATAGRAARVAARHCQQVLAGIGYTTEHDLHRYVRRVLVLEQLLGSTRNLTRELGDGMLERREVPALLPL